MYNTTRNGSKLFLLASIKKNLAYYTVLSASQVLLPLLSIPYISRVLDPDGIGRVGFMDSFTYYFISVAEFGIVVYGMREIARLKDDLAARTKLVSELLVLHIISSAITLVLYFISVYFVWEKIRDVRLLLFSLSFLLVNSFACEWYFLGMERFKYITLRSLTTRLLGLASIFVLINSADDYYLYYGIIVVAAILNSLWNNYVLFRELPLSFRRVNWKKHIVHTRITYFISLTYDVTLLLDNVLLRMVSTASAVAFYALPMKMARTLSALLTDSLLVFFPKFVSSLKENNTKWVQDLLLKNLRLLIFFGVPVCMGLYLVSEQLISVFLGNQFLPSIVNLKILAIYPLVRGYNLFLSKQVLIAHNKEKLYLVNLVLGDLLFIILTLSLSYYFADLGACFAILSSELFILVLNYYFARKTAANLQLFDNKAFWQAGLSAALMIPVVYLVKLYGPSPFSILFLSAGTGALVYLLMQFYVMRNDFSILVKDKIVQFLWRRHS